jgi:hypothetical protein
MGSLVNGGQHRSTSIDAVSANLLVALAARNAVQHLASGALFKSNEAIGLIDADNSARSIMNDVVSLGSLS